MDKKQKKEPSEIMKAYIEAANLEKKAVKEKEALKPKAVEELKDDPEGYQGITYSTREPIKFVDDLFYAWVVETFPEQAEACTKKTIDYKAFEDLVAKGLIKYDELPDNIYTMTPQDVLTISPLRTKKGN